jgi:hypothetical protein
MAKKKVAAKTVSKSMVSKRLKVLEEAGAKSDATSILATCLPNIWAMNFAEQIKSLCKTEASLFPGGTDPHGPLLGTLDYDAFSGGIRYILKQHWSFQDEAQHEDC